MATSQKEGVKYRRPEMPKTGTEFLVSSHFKLGLEPQWMSKKNPLAYCSTFKKDYPPHPLTATDKITLPRPAVIMHQNGGISDQYCSITKGHFLPMSPSKRSYENSTYALTKTNFKMDSDKQIESFKTTHTECYQPYKADLDAHNLKQSNWMASHIPQGDKQKVLWPNSDYQGNFSRHDYQERESISNPLFLPSNTIRGDARVDEGQLFFTTTQSAYPYKHSGRKDVDYRTKYPLTNIPQGDKEKFEERRSTKQASFPPLDSSEYSTVDRSKALSKLQGTSFKMGDNRSESFSTTAHTSYRIPVGGGRGIPAGLNMNKSSLPEGDRDTLRSLQRISTTLNRSDFVAPPSGYGNPKVDGSKIRTLSHVDFGSDDRQKSYQTTMNNSFPRSSVEYRRRLGDTSKSSIPTHYYDDLVHEPSYKIDFLPNDGVSRIYPNPAALELLKKSHIQLPLSHDREFYTTHRITYTPKRYSRERVSDSGRIQRSSVPLGTFTASI